MVLFESATDPDLLEALTWREAASDTRRRACASENRVIPDLILYHFINAETAVALAGFAMAMAVATVDALHLPVRRSPLTRAEFVRPVVPCAFLVGISAGLAKDFGADQDDGSGLAGHRV